MSAALFLILLSGVVACALFTVNAAETDEPAALNPYDPFGSAVQGRYTLSSTTYRLTADVMQDGYLYIPSNVMATIFLKGFNTATALYRCNEAAVTYFNRISQGGGQ